MSADFSSVCDEFYASSRLFLKLDMPLERETVLHFFDRIRKEFPTMSRFHRRDDGCPVLEEEPEIGVSRSRRNWTFTRRSFDTRSPRRDSHWATIEWFRLSTRVPPDDSS